MIKKIFAFVVYVSVSIHLLQDSDPITSSIDYQCTTAGKHHTYLLNMKVKIIYQLLFTFFTYLSYSAQSLQHVSSLYLLLT